MSNLIHFHELDNSEIRSVQSRIKLLKQLKTIILENEPAILDAIHADTKRDHHISRVAEIFTSLSELDEFVEHLEEWAAPRPREASDWITPSTNYLLPQPRGKVFIITPWNYPVNLTLCPIIANIAAGNSMLVRMSNNSMHVFNVYKQILKPISDKVLRIVEMNHQESDEYTQAGWDFIMYTGSPSVGKHVMSLAAKTLTPVMLELGGKCPVYVGSSVNMNVIKRVMWGKQTNSGQTCVAPDYIMVQRGRINEMIKYIQTLMHSWYPEGMKESKNLSRIIVHKHFNELKAVIDVAKTESFTKLIQIGDGEMDEDEQYVPLTLAIFESLEDAKKSEVMKHEIFGPILPIIPVDNAQVFIDYVNSKPKPLALYVMTEDDTESNYIMMNTSSGAYLQNETFLHFADHSLPFGGIGNSGMGGYHLKFGFDSLSHLKPIMLRPSSMEKATEGGKFFDEKVRYLPYTTEGVDAFKDFVHGKK